MNVQFNLEAQEFDTLNALGDQALDQANTLAPGSIAAKASVCDVVKDVLPVLKTAESIVCKLVIIPGLKQVCSVLKQVIAILENICPTN